MITIPNELRYTFLACLAKHKISNNIHHRYLKWLRYYLDFCTKYHHNPRSPSSLPKFLSKLQNKRQRPDQLEEARGTIELYYKLRSELHEEYSSQRSEGSNSKDQPFSDKKTGLAKKSTQTSHLLIPAQIRQIMILLLVQ